MPKYTALLFASSGNVLGIIVNYYIGFLFYKKTKTKLYKTAMGRKSFVMGEKYGYFALALSWLPIIGDPLTLVAGVLRLRFLYFILITASLRILRYYFLTFMI